MISAYILRGVVEEYCMVFKAADPEDIMRIIKRLCNTRDKDLKELGEQLERDFNDRQRDSGTQQRVHEGNVKPRPKNGSKIQKRK